MPTKARTALSIAVVAVLTLLVVSPASAADSQCGSGQTCIWQSNSYSVGFFGTYGDVKDLRNVTWYGGGGNPNDMASSVVNYGNNCNTQHFEDLNQTGHYFNLSRPSAGGTYKDPNMSNGAGTGAYWAEDWNDRVTSYKFVC